MLIVPVMESVMMSPKRISENLSTGLRTPKTLVLFPDTVATLLYGLHPGIGSASPPPWTHFT
jgi:hypothetical protein